MNSLQLALYIAGALGFAFLSALTAAHYSTTPEKRNTAGVLCFVGALVFASAFLGLAIASALTP